jgi:hypothetical protein
MLEYLLDVERRLPQLLKSMDGWLPRFVTYEKPHVERLYREDGPNRIYLHRIHKCEEAEAFLHIHPWPSAMRVVSGHYAMRVGVDVAQDRLYNKDRPSWAQFYEHAAKLIIGPGTAYEMTNIDAMHSVQPLTDTTLSLMVTGPVWSKSTAKQKQNPDLPQEAAQRLLQDFRNIYR